MKDPIMNELLRGTLKVDKFEQKVILIRLCVYRTTFCSHWTIERAPF